MTHAIILAETYSTPVRLETTARRTGTLHFMVTPDGKVKTLSKVGTGVEHITVVIAKEKAGDRIFTPWEMTYVVPSEVQLEAVWALTQRLVKTYKLPNTICGVTTDIHPEKKPLFRWGWVENPTGIAARERSMPHQGGLIPEFYCLARAHDMSPTDARALAMKQASRGESCDLPGATK